MDKMNLLKEIFNWSLYGIRLQKNNVRVYGKYDPGKYGMHIEKIEKGIYGLYYQTYDSAEGDTWEAWIVQIRGNELKELIHNISPNRMYHSNYFKKELAKIPYGKIK